MSNGRSLLSESPLFLSLGEKEIRALIKNLPEMKFEAGARLIEQGKPGTRAFILLEGRVLVAAHKVDVPLKIMLQQAPSLIGFIEISRSLPCIGDVIALEPCSALVFERSAFLELLHRNHQVCVNLIQFLCQELYQTAKDLRVRLFGKVEHILANTLRYYGLIYGEEREYGLLIRKEINKSELASLLGIARRSVIRAMEALEEEGLIRSEGPHVVIPDFVRLTAKADECWTDPESPKE